MESESRICRPASRASGLRFRSGSLVTATPLAPHCMSFSRQAVMSWLRPDWEKAQTAWPLKLRGSLASKMECGWTMLVTVPA